MALTDKECAALALKSVNEGVAQWAELMAKYKLTRLTLATGLSLEMSPLGFSMPEPVSATNDAPDGERMPTEDELLMWSAGGALPDVEAKAPKEDA